MPRIEPTVSLGNVLNLIGSALMLAGVYAAIRSDITDARSRISEHERRLTVQEVARERDDRETGQLREQLAGRLVSLEVAVKTLTNTLERMDRSPVTPRGNL